MAISNALKRVYASAPSNRRYIDTLQLSHPAFPTTFYITNNPAPWTFDLGDGTLQLFSPVNFQVVQPTADGRGQQDLQLAIDNVGRDAMEAIELAAAEPQIPITVILRTYLDVANSLPQNTPPLTLWLTDITVTMESITGTAGRSETLNRPFPTMLYRTDTFPGLDR